MTGCGYNFIRFSMCSYNFNVAVKISINLYEEDYQSITSYFTEDFVPYEDTIKNMRKIIQNISF